MTLAPNMPLHTNTTPLHILQTGSQEIFFPHGLIGFYEHKEFYLHHFGEDAYLLLESKKDPSVRFLLCSLPWDFYPSKDLVDGLISENLSEIDDLIYAIVCCSGENPSLNLRAPIVRRDDKMWQIVMNAGYPLDYPLE